MGCLWARRLVHHLPILFFLVMSVVGWIAVPPSLNLFFTVDMLMIVSLSLKILLMFLFFYPILTHNMTILSSLWKKSLIVLFYFWMFKLLSLPLALLLQFTRYLPLPFLTLIFSVLFLFHLKFSLYIVGCFELSVSPPNGLLS